jgi:DNA-binding NtrC family response regulator
MEKIPAEDMKMVWIVDDETELAENYAEYLAPSYRTKTFCNPEAALLEFETDSERPSVIVSDLKMPGSMDGLGFAEVLNKTAPEIPVIMLSGFAERPHLAMAIDAQVYSFMDKPCDPNILRGKIEGALSSKEKTVTATQLIQELHAQSKSYEVITQLFVERYVTAENLIEEHEIPLNRNPEETRAFLGKVARENKLMREIEKSKTMADRLIGRYFSFR